MPKVTLGSSPPSPPSAPAGQIEVRVAANPKPNRQSMASYARAVVRLARERIAARAKEGGANAG